MRATLEMRSKVFSLVQRLFRFCAQLAATAAAAYLLELAKRFSLSLDVKSQDASQQGAPPLPILTFDPKHTSAVTHLCLFTFRFTAEVTTSKDRGCKLDGGVSPSTHPPAAAWDHRMDSC